jgi:hypothetical protein
MWAGVAQSVDSVEPEFDSHWGFYTMDNGRLSPRDV